MLSVPLHLQPALPLPSDVAVAILGVGALVFALIAYDTYRYVSA